MYFKFFFFVSILHSCFANTTDPLFPDGGWPHNLKTHFPFPTYAPMRIDTTLARPFNSSTPLVITIPIRQKLQITNTGKTVIATPQEPAPEFTISGGILGNEVFEFDSVFYSWTQDHLEYTASTTDGAGAPVVGVVVFYNRRYKSLLYAKQQRDGVVFFTVKVVVQGTLPNADFANFEPALRSVITSGSNGETTVGAATSFFSLDPEPTYYAYPGAYYETSNDKQIFSTTIIELPKSHYPSISIHQFSAFTNLKSRDNTPINSRVAGYAPDSRPLVQGYTVIHTPV